MSGSQVWASEGAGGPGGGWGLRPASCSSFLPRAPSALGGLSSRGTARGRGTRVPLTTAGSWADGSAGRLWGGQPRGRLAPGWSAPRMSPATAEGGGSPCGLGGGDMTPSLSPPRELSPEPVLAEGLERNWAPLWAVTGWLRRVAVNDLEVGGGGDWGWPGLRHCSRLCVGWVGGKAVGPPV